MLLKLCPQILDDPMLLHRIKSDQSMGIMEIILRKNPQHINAKDADGQTPLVMLASHPHTTQCIAMLLGYHADYEQTDNQSNTFLHNLASHGSIQCIQNVVRNVTSIIDAQNNTMMSASMIAAKHGHEEVLYILKGLGANLGLHDVHGNTAYHYICESKICPSMLIVNRKNKYGFTPSDYCAVDLRFYHFSNSLEYI